MKNNQWDNYRQEKAEQQIFKQRYDMIQHVDRPRSFLGMVEVKEKVADRCGG